MVSRTVTLSAEQAEPVRSLWLQIHGLRYADQASVQINTSAWIPLNNNTVTIAEPGRSYGGIGGGFATLVMTLALPDGTVAGGDNTIRFRFNHTDGFVSSYRVLALNFLNARGKEDSPGQTILWKTRPKAGLHPCPTQLRSRRAKSSGMAPHWRQAACPTVRNLQAHCADCHAQDGRDLKYFNFSNASIVARARFHGLSELQSEQIASYIRSSATAQSWPPVEPSLPTRTWTGRTTGLELGGRRRTRLGPRSGYGRIAVSGWQHGDGTTQPRQIRRGTCSQPR